MPAVPPPHLLPALLKAVRDQHPRVAADTPEGVLRWLLVDTGSQLLALVRDDRIEGIWPVSTAAAGLDNRQDSGGTPPGLHTIARRIGDGAEPGTVFVDRTPTGHIWQEGEEDPDDLIISRILTLSGREEGLNLGPGVDSQERYIYIHGTNHPDRIGEPVSHGCVRMTDPDIRTLFELVAEGDPVVVV